MKTASIFEELEGRTIAGEFPLLERLGGSADCGVFLTVRQGIQRSVIKLKRTEGIDVDAFLAQWETAKGLSHPNLLRVYEAGRRSVDGVDLLYVVTEPADEVLSRVIEERALDPQEARETLISILDVLNYLHAKGFVHGHVKPSNILLVSNVIKLSADDFVVAGPVQKHIRKPGDYDAPEALAGTITPATDIWSVGISLTVMLTQHLPRLDWSANGRPVVSDSLPQPFFDIVRDCLRLEPQQRCTIAQIKAFLARDPVPESATAAARPAPPPVKTEPETAPAAAAQAQATANAKPNVPDLPPTAADPKPGALETEAETAETKIETQPAPVAPKFNSFTARPHKLEASPRIVEAGTAAPVAELFKAAERDPAPPLHEPVDPTPAGKWGPPSRPASRWEEVDSPPPPLPELFTGYEEIESRRFRVVPILLGILVLIGFAGFLLVRSGKIEIPWLDNLANLSLAKSAPQPQQQQQQPASPLPETTQQNASQQQQQPQQTTPGNAQATPPPQQPASPPANPDEFQTSESGNETPAPPAATKPATSKTPAQPKLAPKPAPPEPPAAPANVEAAVARQVMPKVAEGAREGMRGPVQVTVRVDVDRNGNVTDAAYVTPGEGNYFARVSHRAAQQWKFRAPARNGQPQPSVWTLHFNFSRSKADVTATLDEP